MKAMPVQRVESVLCLESGAKALGGREWDLSTKEEEGMSLGEGRDWIVVV